MNFLELIDDEHGERVLVNVDNVLTFEYYGTDKTRVKFALGVYIIVRADFDKIIETLKSTIR